jgi:DNA processing protein
VIDACDNCVRRSHLLARLAPHIEHAAIDRPGRRAPELLALDDAALVAAVGGSRRHEILAAHRAAHPAELRRRAASAGCWAVCRHASGYPEALRDLGREAPAALFGCGALDVVRGLDPGTVVTIVGARRASAYGLGVGEQLARLLGAAGLGVVSGMANGIDSRAHAGALDGGGRTVAVLGGGADVPYPKRQARLHRRIRAEGGAVVSEMPPGTASFRWSFPARNRLMAALSRITVVVEAAERSGSLITATMALELGRDVGAVPGPVNAWLSAGTNQLLADGAEVVRDAQDVLDHLLGAGCCNLRELGPEIDAGLREVLERVEGGETTCDAVALAGGRPAHEVSSALARLELLGYLTSDHTGRYSRTPLVAPAAAAQLPSSG